MILEILLQDEDVSFLQRERFWHSENRLKEGRGVPGLEASVHSTQIELYEYDE